MSICTDIDHADLVDQVEALEAALAGARGALEFIETAARNSKRLDATVVALYAADVRRHLEA